jgi:hypothetical protein
MAEEAQRTEARGSDAVVVVQQAALTALNDLGPAVGKSHALYESLWGRATAYNASDEERLQMAEGWQGCGNHRAAIPMAEAFKFTQAQFHRLLPIFSAFKERYESRIAIHNCGVGVMRVLTSAALNHLQDCLYTSVT